jgi:hypothetical protein
MPRKPSQQARLALKCNPGEGTQATKKQQSAHRGATLNAAHPQAHRASRYATRAGTRCRMSPSDGCRYPAGWPARWRSQSQRDQADQARLEWAARFCISKMQLAPMSIPAQQKHALKLRAFLTRHTEQLGATLPLAHNSKHRGHDVARFSLSKAIELGSFQDCPQIR